LLGIFAERDEYANPATVEALDDTLTRLGKPHEFVTYRNTDHAFFNDARPSVYNTAAAADAWERTIRFLRTQLAQG
jgi:carboxymethylenebutenolidase